MTLFAPPSGYTRIKVVTSFHALTTTPLAGGVNAICWQRRLPGSFSEVVEQLGVGEGVTSLDEARLNALHLSAAGRVAVEILLEDQQLLRDLGHLPVLECVQDYPRDDGATAVPTDVYSFHADSATVATDTYLCTYHGPASEGLRNDEALRRVDIAQTRAELLCLFGGEDNDEFKTFLSENCYDLHYLPVAEAKPFSFGQGNLWRVAVRYPGSQVPPCIHRAPATDPAQSTRLLLIA